jgi:hypothetical protein
MTQLMLSQLLVEPLATARFPNAMEGYKATSYEVGMGTMNSLELTLLLPELSTATTT